MMLATFQAARYGRDELKPRELIIGQNCYAWGTLPRSGGYFDQPVRLMRRMSSCLNIYNATKAWLRSSDWVEFSRRFPDDWAIIQELIMLENNNHG